MNVQALGSRQGFALASAMLYIAILTVVIASVLNLVMVEYRATRSSAAYLQALYAAEAGVDLALCEFNKDAKGEAAWKGWVKEGSSYRLESALAVLCQGSTFMPQLNVVADASAMKITAAGNVMLPQGSVIVSRNVVVTLKRQGQTYAVQNWEESGLGR